MSPTDNPRTQLAWRFLPAIACMIVIFTLSAQPALPQAPGLGDLTSVAGHFSVYFVLAILIWWALGVFEIEGRNRAVLAFTLAVLYGLTDEWHQSYVPGRVPDILDILTDAIGAATGLLLLHLAMRRWPTFTLWRDVTRATNS